MARRHRAGRPADRSGVGLALGLVPQAETVTRWIDVYMPSGYMGGFLYVCSVAVLICLAVPASC